MYKFAATLLALALATTHGLPDDGHNVRHHKSPPDEIEVAWDALSNTYVCLFDGACRLALEATSPAERAVPRSRHTKWSKV